MGPIETIVKGDVVLLAKKSFENRETYCWWFRNLAPVDMVNIPLFTGFIHPSWCRISSINSVNSTTTQTGKSAKGVLVSQWDIKIKIEAFNCFCSVNFWKSSVLPPFFRNKKTVVNMITSGNSAYAVWITNHDKSPRKLTWHIWNITIFDGWYIDSNSYFL